MPFPEDEIEAIRLAYAALNRGDVSGFVGFFDAGVVRVEPADFPQGGTYRGLDAVREHVEKGRATWAEGGCVPERFTVVGDRIVVLIQVRVRLKGEETWREGRIGDAFTFRDGKAIEFRTFSDERAAVKWAGGGGG